MKLIVIIFSILGIGIWFVEIITVQSYPLVGDFWSTEFRTYGLEKELIITPIENTVFGVDIVFDSLKCGSKELSPQVFSDSIVYSNWSCNEKAYFKVKVLTTGKHSLEFKYGNDIGYSYNFATKDKKITINNSNINVEGVFVKGVKAKKIMFTDITEEYNIKEKASKDKKELNNYFNTKKTLYYGDIDIKLKHFINVTINESYKCDCKNEFEEIQISHLFKKTENVTTLVCDKCYKNVTNKLFKEINPKTFTLKKNEPIYEVIETKRIEKKPDGTWGFSVWSDVNILGIKVKNASWWNSSWYLRKNVTIDFNKVSGMQTNFPVLINITDSDLASDAQNDGDDIMFTNSTGTKLDHEIEHFNSTTGWLVAWIRIPILSNETDTTIWMYYNNSGASNQENVTGVWDENYVMVQHLQETPAGTTYDSTLNSNYGTTSGMDSADQVLGQVDGSLDFDGSNDYVEMSGESNFDFGTEDWALGCWFKADFAHNGLLLGKGADGAGGIRYKIYVLDTGEIAVEIDDNGVGIGKKNIISTATTYGNDGLWHYIFGIKNGNNLRLYIDGTEDATSPADITGVTSLDTDYPVIIGKIYNSAGVDFYQFFNGIIDEVSVSNIARPDNWIKTSYTNQNSPSTFYTIGSEEICNLFNITLPDNSEIKSSESGTATTTIEFNITTGHSQKNILPCVVGGSCQDDTHPFKFENTGSITESWLIKLNETINCFSIFGSLSNTMSNSFEINDTWYIINNSIPVSSIEELWIKGNATLCTTGNAGVILLTHNVTIGGD